MANNSFSILDENTTRVLDDLFREAQQLFDDGSYECAYEKCDDIRRLVEKIQSGFIKIISRGGTVLGVVGGLVFPGVGNLVGGIVGGLTGRWIGQITAKWAICTAGTYEEIRELSIAGKQEAKAAVSRRHLSQHGQLPIDTPIYAPEEGIYLRWLRIRKEVLGI